MAEECGESSVAVSSSNWGENIHGSSAMHPLSWTWRNQANNPSSVSPRGDDISVSSSYNTNNSIQSGLTVESSRRMLDPSALPMAELMVGEHMSDNQLWSHMLLSTGNNGENFLDSLSSKSMSSFDRHMNYESFFVENPRLVPCSLNHHYRQSNLANGWSIAPPVSEAEHLTVDSPSGLHPSGTYHKRYDDMKAAKCHYRSFDDDAAFGDGLSGQYRRFLEHHHIANKPSWKLASLSEHSAKKQGTVLASSSSSSPYGAPQARGSNVKGQASTNTGAKRKRSEDNSETTGITKKPKNESSTTSAARVTKVKLGDRITTLQQIVSPFGKTDTASVLMEAVSYIKFLQEQVRLLVSNPYLKANPHRDLWGGLDRMERSSEMRVDLRSRGFCLVPISCTPPVYRENSGSDYWTPSYRSVLYR